MKISVVMASYLGEYPDAASNRIEKFRRAIRSFQRQAHPEKELVVVADGCNDTEACFFELMGVEIPSMEPEYTWSGKAGYRFVKLFKQDHFSGRVRDEGIKYASGDIISYLDTDDVLFGNHLQEIVNGFSGAFDWVYFDDYVATSSDLQSMRLRSNMPAQGRIGTSSIAHKKNL
ncbi:MAG TPA: glycosyltransferase family A protein, partial [Anaerovoracaceae bacterium]|nr:glycosyltransferase family A protein [Anaerovoracaceae bacterium]